MTSATSLNAAETWEAVYQAFQQVNFVSYDFNAVKQSLLDYLKFYYPENFNDYIESSQLIAIIELFAYIAEQHAYRVDMSIHEAMIDTAERKQSILRLAKLVSYTATRNVPLRGYVKITSISSSQLLYDSQGNALSNKTINWNDQNNSQWKEQFFTVMNAVMTNQFGSPLKSFQIDDTVFQQYELQNVLESDQPGVMFRNGCLPIKTTINGSTVQFELVPADVDSDTVFERTPSLSSYFTLLYADDGYGDGSMTTGFLMYIKQGTMSRVPYIFTVPIPNQSVDIALNNINDADVWVQEVDATGVLINEWEQVDTVFGQNLQFNVNTNLNKFEIETLENDQIRLIFGDGDFSNIPTGYFNFWVRQSTSGSLTLQQSQLANQTITFAYTSDLGNTESVTLTFSLTAALQNSAESEDIEHVRTAAPATYYSQNRMVNGQDYNTFVLKDPSILRVMSVNRTFAGQPKYINWNDASGMYQNVKIFGNDLRMYYNMSTTIYTETLSARTLIDQVIEPALSDAGVYNTIAYSYYLSASPLNLAYVRPRTAFIENAAIGIQEKTAIQGALDRHWYGEPDTIVYLASDYTTTNTATLPSKYYAVVNSDTDHLIYDSTLPLVLQNSTTGTYAPVNITPNNTSGIQNAVTRQQTFGIAFNPVQAFETANIYINDGTVTSISPADSISTASINQSSAIVEVLTVEITDADGTFTVYGSINGFYGSGMIGQVYTNGYITFLIGTPTGMSTPTYIVGDAFIIQLGTAGSTIVVSSISRANLLGQFTIIPEASLAADASTAPYDPTNAANSWVILVQRIDDSSGNLLYWTVTQRDFQLVVESPTTNFWFDNSVYIVDPDTQLRVVDQVRLLKSNLDLAGTQAIGTDQIYNVTDKVNYDDGDVNINALKVTADDNNGANTGEQGLLSNPYQFLNFIGTDNYVYFETDATTGNLLPVAATATIIGYPYVDDVYGSYVRKQGRDGLDFMWQHFTSSDRLIDPSPSNIIDMYVLTRGYYSQMQNYVNGVITTPPTPPTSLDLRTTYSSLIESKMLSDTVVLHSANIKMLFGNQADPQLQATFKIVKSASSTLTDDQVRVQALDTVQNYFSITNWTFGQTFYATDLCSQIHYALGSDVASVVLVPNFPNNYFGDLFTITAGSDEIFISCAQLSNIQIIQDLNSTTLKQR